MYLCQNCGKEITQLEKFITCPFCGNKILKKQRPPIAKKVKAR